MDILALRIKNFLTVGEADLRLDNKGLVLIRGENKDDPSANSNGSGKSSIPDAICWALYGETARGTSGDAVVNKTAKHNCRVDILLRDGDTVYRITRFRKDKEFKNVTFVRSWTWAEHEEGGYTGVELHKATEKETQEVINAIMGCSLEVFVAAIYAGQEAMPDLPKMTDKQLKSLIEQASGVERLEKAYEIARGRVTVAKANLDGTTTATMRIESERASALIKLREQAVRFKEFENTREERSKVFKNEAEDLRGQVAKLEEAAKPLFDKETAIRNELSKLSTTLSEHRELTAKHGELNRIATSAGSDVVRASTTYENEGRVLKTIKHHIDNAAEEMKKPCSECGKPHTADELEEYKAHLTKRLHEQADKVKAAKAILEAKQTISDEAHKAAMDFAATLPDVTEIAERQKKLNEFIVRIGNDRASIKVMADRADISDTKAAMVMTEANPYKESLRMLNDEIKEADEALVKLKAEQKEREHKLEVAQAVATVYSPAGVRAHILDTVTPFLNDRTSDYLGALSDGSITAVWSTLGETKAGELREKFNIDVVNDKGAEDFTGLSGGEKRKVRLATMLALQDLVASRAVKPINLWIGDEVDDALDVAGLERLMGIMERKARERGTVLVISHNDLSDWIDNQATVTKSGGVSTVEGVLCV